MHPLIHLIPQVVYSVSKPLPSMTIPQVGNTNEVWKMEVRGPRVSKFKCGSMGLHRDVEGSGRSAVHLGTEKKGHLRNHSFVVIAGEEKVCPGKGAEQHRAH